MGKTYGFDPREEAVTNRPSWERSDGDCDFEEYAPKPKKLKRKAKSSASPAPMTPEWAIELMRDRVGSSLDLLVVQNVIPRHEFEDYEQIINAHICRILPTYDGNRKGSLGRTSGVERFLWVAVDNVVKNIKTYVARRRKNLPTMPMIEVDDDDEDEDTKKDCEGESFSDHCKNFKELWLRMDVEVLMRMLNTEERTVLALRLDGLTYPEIVEELKAGGNAGIDRFHVMNVTMEGIRKAARKCGFVPYSEMRGEKIEK